MKKKKVDRAVINTKEGLKIQIVPFSDFPITGYIRFEFDGKYVGSLNEENRKALQHIRKAVNELLNIKRKKNGDLVIPRGSEE